MDFGELVWFAVFLVFSDRFGDSGLFSPNDFQENLYQATCLFLSCSMRCFLWRQTGPLYFSGFDAYLPDCPGCSPTVAGKMERLSKLQKGLAVFVLCAITVLLFMQVRFSMMTDIPTYQEYLRVNM
jgi:hypothetical protein